MTDWADAQCAVLAAALGSVHEWTDEIAAEVLVDDAGEYVGFARAPRERQLELLARLRVRYAETFGVEDLIAGRRRF